MSWKAWRDLASLNWNDWLYMIFSTAISAAMTVIAANPLATVLGAQAFTPRQLLIMAGSAAIVAVAGKLQKSPLPSRAMQIALTPGVHTKEEVEKILKATAPGEVPTKEVAAAILNKPVPPDA